MWHQTLRFTSWITLTNQFYHCPLAIRWFSSSWELTIFKASKFSRCLKGKTDVCDGVSEGGDRTHSEKLHAVILTDFQSCCQASNVDFFFPSVTQRRQTPQLRWDRECLFYQGGHHVVQPIPNKSIHLLLTARIPQWWRWVVLPRRLLRVHYTCDPPAISLTNILNHFICLYFSSWGLIIHQTHCL